MSSIIEGYNYDIFISYRQKDNKGDRWVSEFVDALETELESTFKEDLSVYFDINPHDGLLETHDVDASLKDKLKCLIFIPVISRTYCDPKSFAWEHEFKAFIGQASADKFGIKIKLPHGNVAARVLPVRIHELDPRDNNLCESVMGGPIRGVDFIYKSPGVNRPLRINEDSPKDNLNHTYYRDQINKVANAVREIIEGLKYHDELPALEQPTENTEQLRNFSESKKHPRRITMPAVLKIVLPLIFLGLAVFVIIFSNAGMNRSGKRVALIPLTIIGDEKLENDASTLSEMLNDKLKVVGINIVPRLSMLQYTDTDKPLKVISRELNAKYVVYGSIKRENGEVVIWLELIAGRANNSLWSDRYTWGKEKISAVTLDIIRNIAGKIEHELSPEEVSLIGSDLTENTDANLNYLSANAMMNDATFFSIYGTRLRDSTDFISAMKSYDKALELDSLFAEAYAGRSTAISWGIYTRQLDSSYIDQCRADALRSLELKKSLPEGQIALGFYYYYCLKNELQQALAHFKTAAELTPFDYHPIYYMALVYRRMGQWEESQKLMHSVIKNNPTEALFLTNIGLSYQYLHDYDSAIIFHQKAIEIMPGWYSAYVNKLYSILLRDGNNSEAWQILDTAASRSGKDLRRYRILLYLNGKDFEKALAEAKQLPSESALTGEKHMNLAAIYDALGNSGLSRSYYDSAIVIFNRFAEYVPESPEIQISLSIAHAGAGNREKAIAAGENAIRLSRNDNMVNTDMKASFSQVLTELGEYDRALVLIDNLLKNPSPVSVKALQTDPAFEDLKKNDAFRRLLKKYSRN